MKDSDEYVDSLGAERITNGVIKRQTFNKYRCYGEGPPYIKLGKRVLYRVSDVKDWIESKRIVPGQGRT